MTTPINSQPTQYVILDTCILQYLNNANLRNEILLFLGELLGRGFGLAITDVSHFELTKHAFKNKETDLYQTLSLFTTFNLNTITFGVAANLSTIYKQDGIPDSQISDCDILIASATLLTGSLILTANPRDFPIPFFSEAEKRKIFYKKNNNELMLVLCLLRPDNEVIVKTFETRK